MGKTKYQSRWSSNFNWVKPSKKSENYAYCCICCTDINISAGVTQLQLHEKTKKNTRTVLKVHPNNQSLLLKMVMSLWLIKMERVKHFLQKI